MLWHNAICYSDWMFLSGDFSLTTEGNIIVQTDCIQASFLAATTQSEKCQGKKKKKKSQNPTGKKFLYLHLCKIVPQPIACNGLDEQIQQYLCCLRQHCCHLSICAKQLGPLASNRPRYLRVFNTNTTFRSLFRSWKISILVLQLQQIHCTEKHQQAKWAKGITAC